MNSHARHRFCITPFAGFALILVSTFCVSAHAQTKLEEGEQVKVLYLNGWFDGVVLGREKNRYGIEFEFAGGKKREMFDRANTRKLCEIDAMDLARTWESSNGKFKVEAALKTYAADKILLSKTDGNEIEVPVASLGAKDVAYLSKFKKNMEQATSKGLLPAAVPKLPELESFGGAFGDIAGIQVGEGRVSTLGELPKYYQEFEQSGTGFYFARDRQEIVAVIPVGGPEQLVLLTAREDNFINQGAKFQSQAYWVSLKQKKVLGSVALTPEDYIVDYDPKSKRLLSVHKDTMRTGKEKDFLTVWNLKPGDKEAEPLVRWETQFDPSNQTIFAKIVSTDIVLAKTATQTYAAWDTSKKQFAYSFKSASFFDAAVVLSPDRKSILIPEDGKVTVLNAVTGDLQFSLRVDDRHVSGVGVDSSGKRLACLTERSVYVWDLTSSDPQPKVYSAPLIGSPFGSRIEWVNDDLLLAESQTERVLYRLSLELPVWSYRMDVAQYWLNKDPLTNQVLDGLFFYVAEPDRFNGSIAVGAVKLPGPKVDELTKNVDRKSLMLMKPGVRVKLNVGPVSDPARVQQWLAEKIQTNGWVIDQNASISIFAEMGVGKTQSETYREMGRSGNTTSVTFTPHFANLVIKQGETIVWQTGTSTGPPPIVRAVDIQAAVSQSEVPQLDFFRVVSIPGEIIDPKFSRGFGVSQLGLKGIEVVSTSPPGREGDPTEADRKSEKDQQDSRTNRR